MAAYNLYHWDKGYAVPYNVYPLQVDVSCEECDGLLYSGEDAVFFDGSVFCSPECLRTYLWGDE